MTGVHAGELSPEAVAKGEAMNALFWAVQALGLRAHAEYVDPAETYVHELLVILGGLEPQTVQVWCVRTGEGLVYVRKRALESFGLVGDPYAAAERIRRALEKGDRR